MADLTITAASVIAGSNASRVSGLCGETITAGQAVYRDATTGRYMKADTNSATAAARLPAGIALNGGANGQPIVVQTAGDITIGATLAAGTAYYLSGTAGGICLRSDLTTGDGVCQLGIAKSATVLALAIQVPGVTL